MLKNPQKLICKREIEVSDSKIKLPLPDAIFIPCRNRYNNVNKLLNSLNWFDGNIVLLISNDSDIRKINFNVVKNPEVLYYGDFKISKKILSLHTFKNRNPIQCIKNWDLPIKRNFAIIYSCIKGYDKILLLDDDISNLTRGIMQKGVIGLYKDTISGCLIEGFPDTSVIGHIEILYGEPYYPFLSGSCLFVNTSKVKGYFPKIYNEDWIFMVPSINDKTISSIDIITQNEYNSFDDLKRIRLQEFGEIIAEGIFELIYRKNYKNRYDDAFWKEYITYRKSYSVELFNRVDDRYKEFITRSTHICDKISSDMCLKFIDNWEEDLLIFDKLKKDAI